MSKIPPNIHLPGALPAQEVQKSSLQKEPNELQTSPTKRSLLEHHDGSESTAHTTLAHPESPTLRHFSALNIGNSSLSSSISLRGNNKKAYSTASKDEQEKLRRERKDAKKAIKAAINEKPLNEVKSWAAHAKHVQEEEDHKDTAEKTLENLPNKNQVEIADGKIYKYVYNSTGLDSAGKAKAFGQLGHEIAPGGFDSPLLPHIKNQGEHLKNQIMSGVQNKTAVMRNVSKEQIEQNGVYFNVRMPIQGINDKKDKKMDLDTGWIDKRQPDGSTRGVYEATTIIPRGEKSGK